MDNKVTIRDICHGDKIRWHILWDEYNAFFKKKLAPEITSRTWERFLDTESMIFARVAEIDKNIVGFSIGVLHEGTWVSNPVCYLEDLYVDQSYRGNGIGQKLIQDMIDLGKQANWSNLYWHTGVNNPARKLYNKFIKADNFVRYRLSLL